MHSASWPHPFIPLAGSSVELLELEEKHFSDLLLLADDKRIWEHYIFDGSDRQKMRAALEAALVEKERGTQFPYVVFHRAEQKIIGSTRFLEVQPSHRKLEIGWTWLHPAYWASAVNPECKLLLLEFCFEKLQAVRVQLKTDENNLRSRRAIEKTGARFEGVLRSEMLRDNGTLRNSAFYSILGEEWPAAKTLLLELCRTKHAEKPR
jgi:N-acetyltransferase